MNATACDGGSRRPLVSVIVVTYNQERTIGRTLEGILAQEGPFDLEIVVGDDASADSTRAIVQEYAARHPQIRLMPAAPNKGVTRNYLDTLEACRGEYIADCAGDDRWCHPRKLAMELGLMERHPEVALVHTAWRPVYTDGRPAGPEVVLPCAEVTPGREVLLQLLRHDRPQPVHLCTALYRRAEVMAVYQAHREYMRAQCAEDLSIMALLCSRHQVGYLPCVTLDYTTGGENSITHPAKARRAAEFYADTMLTTASLSDMTGVERGVIEPSLRRILAYAVHLAVTSGSPEAVAKVMATARELGLRPSWRSKIKLLIHRAKHAYAHR